MKYKIKQKKISFGYTRPWYPELMILLGIEILKFRGVIEDATRKHPNVNIYSFFRGGYYGRLNLQLNGDLKDLETLMRDIFERLELPDIVDKPRSYFERFFPPRLSEITTKESFILIKKLYREKDIKLYGGYKDGTIKTYNTRL